MPRVLSVRAYDLSKEFKANSDDGSQLQYTSQAASSLKAWWKFEDNVSDVASSVVKDSHGPFDGFYGGKPEPSNEIPPQHISKNKKVVNQSIGFDQDYYSYESYAAVGRSTDFDAVIGNAGTKAFTISAWVKPHSSGESDRGTIIQLGGQMPPGNFSNGVRLFTYKGPLLNEHDRVNAIGYRADFSTNDWVLTTDSNVYWPNEWIHIVITHDVSDVANVPVMYINGKKADVSHQHPSNNNPPAGSFPGIEGGADPQSGGQPLSFVGNASPDDANLNRLFDGIIDEIAIWDAVLDDTTIESLYWGRQGVLAVSSGYLNSPPRTIIRAWDAATGSYPGILRTNPGGRSGAYKIGFDDTNTIIFDESYATAWIEFTDIPRDASTITLFDPAGTKSILEPLPEKGTKQDDIVASGELNDDAEESVYEFAVIQAAAVNEAIPDAGNNQYAVDANPTAGGTWDPTKYNDFPGFPSFFIQRENEYTAVYEFVVSAAATSTTTTEIDWSVSITETTPGGVPTTYTGATATMFVSPDATFEPLIDSSGNSADDPSGILLMWPNPYWTMALPGDKWTVSVEGPDRFKFRKNSNYGWEEGSAAAGKGLAVQVNDSFKPDVNLATPDLDGGLRINWSRAVGHRACDEVSGPYGSEDWANGDRWKIKINDSVKETFEFQTGIILNQANTEVNVKGLKKVDKVSDRFVAAVNNSGLQIDATYDGKRVNLRQTIPGNVGNLPIYAHTRAHANVSNMGDFQPSDVNSITGSFARGSDYKVQYPTLLPVDSKWADFRIATPHLPSDLIASGRTQKGVADVDIHFTPGEALGTFRDDRINIDNNSPFYTTGSSESNVEGFSNPLKSKTQIVINLPTAAPTTFGFDNNTYGEDCDLSVQAGSTPDPNHIGPTRFHTMVYYNFETKTWDKIGPGIDIKGNPFHGPDNVSLDKPEFYGNSNLPAQEMHTTWYDDVKEYHRDFFEDACIGFSRGMEMLESGSIMASRPINNFGFPMHPKFGAKIPQTFALSGSISHPFVLEKFTLEFDAEWSEGTEWNKRTVMYSAKPNFDNSGNPDGTFSVSHVSADNKYNNKAVINNFFILNQRRWVGDYEFATEIYDVNDNVGVSSEGFYGTTYWKDGNVLLMTGSIPGWGREEFEYDVGFTPSKWNLTACDNAQDNWVQPMGGDNMGGRYRHHHVTTGRELVTYGQLTTYARINDAHANIDDVLSQGLAREVTFPATSPLVDDYGDLLGSGEPDWIASLNPGSFAFSAILTVIIDAENDGILDDGNENDILAAFDNTGTLAGANEAIQFPIIGGLYDGMWGFTIVVYSNTSSGPPMTFQYYNAETDSIYTIPAYSYNFISGDTVGSVASPVFLNYTAGTGVDTDPTHDGEASTPMFAKWTALGPTAPAGAVGHVMNGMSQRPGKFTEGLAYMIGDSSGYDPNADQTSEPFWEEGIGVGECGKSQRIFFKTSHPGTRSGLDEDLSSPRGLIAGTPGTTPISIEHELGDKPSGQGSSNSTPMIASELVKPNSPYILMPDDKLVFGWQCAMPYAFERVADGQPGGAEVVGPNMTLAPSATPDRIVNFKLTLYGSLIKDEKEFHHSLNQPLTSDAVHEALLYDNKPLDQFDIDSMEHLAVSTRDEHMGGDMFTRGPYASTVSLVFNDYKNVTGFDPIETRNCAYMEPHLVDILAQTSGGDSIPSSEDFWDWHQYWNYYGWNFWLQANGANCPADPDCGTMAAIPPAPVHWETFSEKHSYSIPRGNSWSDNRAEGYVQPRYTLDYLDATISGQAHLYPITFSGKAAISPALTGNPYKGPTARSPLDTTGTWGGTAGQGLGWQGYCDNNPNTVALGDCSGLTLKDTVEWLCNGGTGGGPGAPGATGNWGSQIWPCRKWGIPNEYQGQEFAQGLDRSYPDANLYQAHYALVFCGVGKYGDTDDSNPRYLECTRSVEGDIRLLVYYTNGDAELCYDDELKIEEPEVGENLTVEYTVDDGQSWTIVETLPKVPITWVSNGVPLFKSATISIPDPGVPFRVRIAQRSYTWAVGNPGAMSGYNAGGDNWVIGYAALLQEDDGGGCSTSRRFYNGLAGINSQNKMSGGQFAQAQLPSPYGPTGRLDPETIAPQGPYLEILDSFSWIGGAGGDGMNNFAPTTKSGFNWVQPGVINEWVIPIRPVMDCWSSLAGGGQGASASAIRYMDETPASNILSGFGLETDEQVTHAINAAGGGGSTECGPCGGVDVDYYGGQFDLHSGKGLITSTSDAIVGGQINYRTGDFEIRFDGILPQKRARITYGEDYRTGASAMAAGNNPMIEVGSLWEDPTGYPKEVDEGAWGYTGVEPSWSTLGNPPAFSVMAKEQVLDPKVYAWPTEWGDEFATGERELYKNDFSVLAIKFTGGLGSPDPTQGIGKPALQTAVYCHNSYATAGATGTMGWNGPLRTIHDPNNTRNPLYFSKRGGGWPVLIIQNAKAPLNRDALANWQSYQTGTASSQKFIIVFTDDRVEPDQLLPGKTFDYYSSIVYNGPKGGTPLQPGLADYNYNNDGSGGLSNVIFVPLGACLDRELFSSGDVDYSSSPPPGCMGTVKFDAERQARAFYNALISHNHIKMGAQPRVIASGATSMRDTGGQGAACTNPLDGIEGATGYCPVDEWVGRDMQSPGSGRGEFNLPNWGTTGEIGYPEGILCYDFKIVADENGVMNTVLLESWYGGPEGNLPVYVLDQNTAYAIRGQVEHFSATAYDPATMSPAGFADRGGTVGLAHPGFSDHAWEWLQVTCGSLSNGYDANRKCDEDYPNSGLYFTSFDESTPFIGASIGGRDDYFIKLGRDSDRIVSPPLNRPYSYLTHNFDSLGATAALAVPIVPNYESATPVNNQYIDIKIEPSIDEEASWPDGKPMDEEFVFRIYFNDYGNNYMAYQADPFFGNSSGWTPDEHISGNALTPGGSGAGYEYGDTRYSGVEYWDGENNGSNSGGIILADTGGVWDSSNDQGGTPNFDGGIMVTKNSYGYDDPSVRWFTRMWDDKMLTSGELTAEIARIMSNPNTRVRLKSGYSAGEPVEPWSGHQDLASGWTTLSRIPAWKRMKFRAEGGKLKITDAAGMLGSHRVQRHDDQVNPTCPEPTISEGGIKINKSARLNIGLDNLVETYIEKVGDPYAQGETYHKNTRQVRARWSKFGTLPWSGLPIPHPGAGMDRNIKLVSEEDRYFDTIVAPPTRYHAVRDKTLVNFFGTHMLIGQPKPSDNGVVVPEVTKITCDSELGSLNGHSSLPDATPTSLEGCWFTIYDSSDNAYNVWYDIDGRGSVGYPPSAPSSPSGVLIKVEDVNAGADATEVASKTAIAINNLSQFKAEHITGNDFFTITNADTGTSTDASFPGVEGVDVDGFCIGGSPGGAGASEDGSGANNEGGLKTNNGVWEMEITQQGIDAYPKTLDNSLDDGWLGAFPFEGKYANLTRQIFSRDIRTWEAVNFDVAGGTSAAPAGTFGSSQVGDQFTTMFVTGSVFGYGLWPGVPGGSNMPNPWQNFGTGKYYGAQGFISDKTGNIYYGASQGVKDNVYKFYYGSGRGWMNSPILSQSATWRYIPEINGWKYGLMSALPKNSDVVYRSDRYGQFRDLLEQRRDTRFFKVTESLLEPASSKLRGKLRKIKPKSKVTSSPVVCKFLDPDGDLTDPNKTWSQNISTYCTSSLPFFDDGIMRNRGEIEVDQLNTTTILID